MNIIAQIVDMSRSALPIKILPRSMSLLGKELNKRQLAGHFKLRMEIIIESHGGKRNKDIASELGCAIETVRRWRKRWHEQEKVLGLLENGYADELPAKDSRLLDKIKAILSDEKRPGAPCSLKESEVDRLVALACESPEKYGSPVTHWTHVSLSQQAIKMGIQISASHTGRLIKKRLTPPQE